MDQPPNSPDHGLLPAVLRYRAETTPNRLAIVAGDERISYAELDSRVDIVAGKLLGLGVQPGQRVATLLRNSARVPAIVHA
ncbi:MAG TPA: AMP-binding protein, partial [Thermomicrobiaceae bacterium]|nr:AMP-binding protein [Thermomicrobiaceae bacterium]